MIKDYSEQLAEDMEKVKALGGDPEAYREKYENLFSAWISAKSRCFSSMITGPAKFPTQKAEKANRSEHNKYIEFEAFRKKYVARLEKNIRVAVRAASNPLEEMREKVAFAEQNQEMMKAANRIIKSRKSDIEKITLLGELNISESAAIELLKKDFCGRIGFASYLLTNNLANIKRMYQRIAEMEAKASTETTEITRPDGIRIVENRETDRLQVFFPSKPAPDMIQKMKKEAFKWAPSNGCWQRQLTENAKHSLSKALIP